jgi:hypothetical protein
VSRSEAHARTLESTAETAVGRGQGEAVAGGAIKALKTTVLMTGEQGVAALKKADAVAKTYKPAK